MPPTSVCRRAPRRSSTRSIGTRAPGRSRGRLAAQPGAGGVSPRRRVRRRRRRVAPERRWPSRSAQRGGGARGAAGTRERGPTNGSSLDRGTNPSGASAAARQRRGRSRRRRAGRPGSIPATRHEPCSGQLDLPGPNQPWVSTSIRLRPSRWARNSASPADGRTAPDSASSSRCAQPTPRGSRCGRRERTGRGPRCAL